MTLDTTDFPDMEEEFCDLVAMGFPKKVFISNAQRMLGEDWQKDGSQIVKEHSPELMKDFESYVNGTQQATT